MKKKTQMTVTDSCRLAEGIYSMTLRYPKGEEPDRVTDQHLQMECRRTGTPLCLQDRR